MKIIVSWFDDTLRKIAKRTDHVLEELIRLNPNITEVDAYLAGTADIFQMGVPSGSKIHISRLDAQMNLLLLQMIIKTGFQ